LEATAIGGLDTMKSEIRALPRLLTGFVLAIAAFNALAAGAPEKTFNMNIVHGALAAHERVLRVDKGDAVRVRVTSDAPGELHLHGYRLEAKLTPGTRAELAFTAYATGRYPFEWHGAERPGPTGSHHGPAFAALEVRPK
jgi:FtsP/CotA-like multicopper oxidase with cupredoxin domain